MKWSLWFVTLTLPLLQGFSSGETNFYLCQFLSNFSKYSSLNFLSSHSNNIFTVYFSGNSLSLNFFIFRFNFTFYTLSNSFCYLTFTSILPSNSSTKFFAFSKFSFFSHVLFSTINHFQHTKYFITPLTFL